MLEEELRVAVAAVGTVTGPAKEIAPPVAMGPCKETAPGVLWVRPPARFSDAELPKVRVPVWATVRAAPVLPVVVVIELFNAKFVPVRLTPPDPVVLMAPLNVVVPLPAICETAAALMVEAVTVLAELMVRVLIGVDPPIAPKTMVPEPAVKVRFCSPLTVPRERLPGPAPPELRVAGPAKVAFPAIEMDWFGVRIDPFKTTAPPPLCVKPPSA